MHDKKREFLDHRQVDRTAPNVCSRGYANDSHIHLAIMGACFTYSFHVREYYETQNDYTNNSETTLCVTDVREIGKLIPREFLCVIGVHRKYFMEAPRLRKTIPARKPCATNVLWNWKINSQIIEMCV